jgi:hypothetical protein
MKVQPDLLDAEHYQQWFDTHINAFVNVAGPLLGAPGTLRSVVCIRPQFRLSLSLRLCRFVCLVECQIRWT